jgi:hypothetical protein
MSDTPVKEWQRSANPDIAASPEELNKITSCHHFYPVTSIAAQIPGKDK